MENSWQFMLKGKRINKKFLFSTTDYTDYTNFPCLISEPTGS